jgi:hypothetical protein
VEQREERGGEERKGERRPAWASLALGAPWVYADTVADAAEAKALDEATGRHSYQGGRQALR